MTRVVKSIVQAIKEKGLGGFLRHAREEGYLKCLADGNILQTKIHNIGAKLVGVDKVGNKYYEKLDVQYGRHRWVEYAEKDRYNASQVPPEWHGWLHYITDHTGDELLMLKPQRYHLNTRRISLVRVMSSSTTPKGTASIQGRETGQGTSLGNQQNPELYLRTCS